MSTEIGRIEDGLPMDGRASSSITGGEAVDMKISKIKGGRVVATADYHGEGWGRIWEATWRSWIEGGAVVAFRGKLRTRPGDGRAKAEAEEIAASVRAGTADPSIMRAFAPYAPAAE